MVNYLFIIYYLLILVLLLVFTLHSFSSSDNNINNSISVIIPFHCYFFKDCSYLIILFIILSLFNFISYDILSNTDNNIEADIFTTPHNILPEWYFLLFTITLFTNWYSITYLLLF